jgi:MFS family permease
VREASPLTERLTDEAVPARVDARPTAHRGAWSRLQSTFGSLAVRDFRYLWLGSFASQLGMWVQQVAVGWLAYDLTGSATFLGVVATSRSLSSVALTLPAGVFADRWDRRRLILFSQTITLINAIVLAWLVATGAIAAWHLAVASFVSGASHSLNMPARQSLGPQLVGPGHIANTVALNSISFNTSRVLGPSIAGILVWIAALGMMPGASGDGSLLQHLALCFEVQAGLMVVAVACSSAMRSVGRPGAGPQHGSIWENLVDGLRYVHRTGPVRAVFLMASVPILVGSVYSQFMPVFARDVLGVGPSGMGALMSAVGFGSLVGSFALAALSHHPRKGRIMVGTGIASGVSLAVFASSQSFSFSLVALAVTGCSLVVCLAMGQTLITVMAPDEYRGRLLSVWSMIWSLEAVTVLPAGWLADHAGAPVTVFICGIVVLGYFVIVGTRGGEVRDYQDHHVGASASP